MKLRHVNRRIRSFETQRVS